MKLKKVRNSWRRYFKESEDKVNLINRFCAQFADLVTSKQYERGGSPLVECIRSWDYFAKAFCVTDTEIDEGWKLHKGWFACMIAQLYYDASMVGNCNIEERLETVNRLFEALDWDFQKSLNPKYTNVTSVMKLPYNYTENGIVKEKFYTVIVEPTDEIPIGARYKSVKNGSEWDVIGAVDNEIELESCKESFRKNGDSYYHKMLLSVKMIRKMERVI